MSPLASGGSLTANLSSINSANDHCSLKSSVCELLLCVRRHSVFSAGKVRISWTDTAFWEGSAMEPTVPSYWPSNWIPARKLPLKGTKKNWFITHKKKPILFDYYLWTEWSASAIPGKRPWTCAKSRYYTQKTKVGMRNWIGLLLLLLLLLLSVVSVCWFGGVAMTIRLWATNSCKSHPESTRNVNKIWIIKRRKGYAVNTVNYPLIISEHAIWATLCS